MCVASRSSRVLLMTDPCETMNGGSASGLEFQCQWTKRSVTQVAHVEATLSLQTGETRQEEPT